jgi:hypothetical protein
LNEETNCGCGWNTGSGPIGSGQRGGYGSASVHQGAASNGRRDL